MVLYFSDNKETEHKKKSIFYEETLPKNAVIFGSTTLKKYNGGPADYMKIGTKRYHINEPANERDVIGYIPVVAEEYPATPSDFTDPTANKYGYIQLTEGFPFLLYLIPIILLLILLALVVHNVDGYHKKDVVLPGKKYEQPAQNFNKAEIAAKPEEKPALGQTPVPTPKPEKGADTDKKEAIAVLPLDPVIIPGGKTYIKSVKTTVPMVSSLAEKTASMENDSKNAPDPDNKNNDKSDLLSTPTPTIIPTTAPILTPGPTKVPDPVTTPTPAPVITPTVTPEPKPVPVVTPTPKPAQEPDTPHVHNYIVEEKEPTCTDLGYYKKYCKDCGYIIADHTCTAMGHALEAVGVSNMTYPDGMTAEYKCKRCGETVTDNFDYTSGLYRADGTLMYTYDALEQLFDWNLSTTPAKEQMDAHTELADGRILVLPSWDHLTEVAEENGKTEGIIDNGGVVNSTENEAFSDTVLTEIVLPNDTPYLGHWFVRANNIEKIELPDSIIEYKGGIFSLQNLKYLKVSAGVSTIVGSFTSCPKVETLIIPDGVTTIQGIAFPMFGTATQNGMNVSLPNTLISFGGCFNNAKIKYLNIPGSVKNLTAITSIDGLEEIVFEEGIEEIPSYFRPCAGLKKITIPSTMKKIGDSAFLDSGLDEIIWNNCNVELGKNVFGKCNLRYLLIPDNTKTINNFIYHSITNADTEIVVFPQELDSLAGDGGTPVIDITNGNSDITGHIIMPDVIHKFPSNWSSIILWDSLEDIVLPGGDYSDCYGLFQNCNKLKEITFTSEITGLNKNFFRCIPSVTDVYYYGSEESINKLIEKYRQDNPNENPYILFMNATIHYMAGTPPTREDLMKKYGVWDEYQRQFGNNNKNTDENNLNAFDLNPIFSIIQQDIGSGVTIASTDNEHTHTLSIEEKAPTCTEDGYYRVTCSTCGETLAEHICHKLGHSMRMVDPEDNTTDIIVPKYKCDRCDYEETAEHTHSWVAKGIENMTYPEGGDSVYICETCLAKKTEHVDAVPGMYDQDGKLKYTYEQLENDFGFDLSSTKLYVIQNNHQELKNMSSLVLPSYDHLLSVATNNGKSSIFINSCFGGASCDEIVLPNGITTIESSWFQGPCVKRLVVPDSVQTIKQSAFSGCMNLETITFPETIKTLESPLFSSSGIKNIVLPKNLENDFVSGAPIIVYESQLESLSIPGGHAIPASFVIQCPKLETLTIMGEVPSIDINAFQGCGLKDVYYYGSEDSMNQIIADAGGSPFGNAKIHYMNEVITNITVESNLTITVSDGNAN